MILRSLNPLRKSISFRITVWYSILFASSFVLLFGLIYFRLSSYVNHKDRQILQAKLEEYVTQFEAGGRPALSKEIRTDRRTDKRISFFVRIAAPDNATLFLSVPEQEKALDYRDLEQHPLHVHARWIDLITGSRLSATEVVATHLPDGSLLQVGKSIKNRELLLERFREIFAGILIPVIVLGFAGGAFLSFRALRPIHDLIDMVRFIVCTGKIHNRVPENLSGDELEDLIVLFNGMLERIEALIDGMRASLDNVAHDLRTPITRLRHVVEDALQGDQGAAELREALMDCAEESERITTMISTLMDISEAETGVMALQMEEVDLSALFRDIIQLYDYVAEDKAITVTTQCPPGLKLWVDSSRIRQVLANLLDNALKYNRRGGRVDIDARLVGENVAISMKDTGEGIPVEAMPRIWDRLYRVDKSRSRRGLGLGLSLVKAIIHAHGGSIEVQSELDKGSLFTIHLPVKDARSCYLE
jgi:signal transduction histidine kinase